MIEVKKYKPGIELKGFIDDMPAEVYHNTEGFISSTGLALVMKSPRHYERRQPLTSDAVQLGTLLHMKMLEPGEFEKTCVSLPDDAPSRPTEAMLKAKNPSESSIARQQWWKEWDEKNKGRIIIDRDDQIKLQEMEKSLMDNPNTRELIEAKGYTELSLFTTDPVSGLRVRCRYDKLIVDGDTLMPVDLKTARDASPDGFSKAIHDRLYQLQAALYTDAPMWETGIHAQTLRHVVVENEEPFCSMRYKLDSISLHLGRLDYRQALTTYHECLKTGIFPGYPQQTGDTIIALPEYVINRREDELGQIT